MILKMVLELKYGIMIRRPMSDFGKIINKMDLENYLKKIKLNMVFINLKMELFAKILIINYNIIKKYFTY